MAMLPAWSGVTAPPANALPAATRHLRHLRHLLAADGPLSSVPANLVGASSSALVCCVFRCGTLRAAQSFEVAVVNCLQQVSCRAPCTTAVGARRWMRCRASLGAYPCCWEGYAARECQPVPYQLPLSCELPMFVGCIKNLLPLSASCEV